MNDLEISQEAKLQDIMKVAKELTLTEEEVINYGKYKAKINLIEEREAKGNLVLVTATNPTPYGEGKTTVSIGLADALNKKHKTVLALRQPSMGPVFGMKGGATGGGYSQIVPMDDINLHFTGDFHAITSANNLLSAAIDNHIFQGNELNIKQVIFQRCLDVNDRSLRNIEINRNYQARDESFNITAASEIMALFTLATSLEDLTTKLSNIIIGYNNEGVPVIAKDLKIEGALTAILKDALMPNLVQTLEQTPAIIHGGPFANIAHGCNSIIATKTALTLGEYVITEAGFGSDLGAEKFMNIKCQKTNIMPKCIVLVSTIKSIKYNGGVVKEDIYNENLEALEKGIVNLGRHIEHLQQYNVPIVVALNQYTTDTDKEINTVINYVKEKGIDIELSSAYTNGSKGAEQLATKVIEATKKYNKGSFLYDQNQSIKDKINTIATKVYKAKEVEYTEESVKEIEQIEKMNFDKLPICIAKTQYSLSDNEKLLGNPENFKVTVKKVKLYNGAGFITVLLGNILTMPGLPKEPNYQQIKISNNKITGIF